MRSQKLGDQELAVLRYVTEQGPASVRQVAEAFAESHQLARTTLLTVLERLRAKGYLSREKTAGSFTYSATQDQKRVTTSLIRDFIGSKLGGSVGTFVAYLSDADGLSETELEELRRIAEKLDGKNADA